MVVALLLLRPGSAATGPSRSAARTNVILITIDTLRADHVGVYGSTTAVTPAIDGLAASGIVFDHAISQVPLTLASHASILTGTYPFYNGVQDFTGNPLSPSFQSVAQAFQRNGYATAAVVSSFVLDRSWGLARGFDVYQDAFAPRSFVEKNVALVERPAAQSVDLALAWLRHRPAKPFFLWLHLYDPHSPYDPPEPFHSRYQHDLYSGEIAYADSQLARLFQYLKSAGIYDRAAIILLSDHGESLGEHGEKEHGFFIYNSTVHVPLVIKPPQVPHRAPGTYHVTGAVEAAAVAPTLLQLGGFKDRIQAQFQTASLMGSIDPGTKEPATQSTAYSETFYPFSSFGWSPLRGLQNDRYQYIQAPAAELYNLATDPHEGNNLLASQGAVASVLSDKLAHLAERYPPPQQQEATAGISPDTVAKLRSLGYVAYKSPVPASALAAGLPDPKSKIEELNAILRAGDMLQLGDVSAGEKLLEEARSSDPGMYIIPFMLGESALRQSQWDKAATEFERSLKLNPNFDQAMTGLARALAQQGNLEGARQWLQKATAANPQNYRAWYELGFIESKDNPEAARVALQKVLQIQPTFALAHRDLGWLWYRAKAYPQALEQFEDAVKLGIDDKNTLNAAGIAASQQGSFAEAIKFYKQAIAGDSSYAEPHLNLGLAYQKSKQQAASQAEYKIACRLQADFCKYLPK